MYLSYEAYQAYGGSLDEESFETVESFAEEIVDGLTFGRLHEVDWSRWEDEVARATWLAVDAADALEASYKAALGGTGSLTSFSNGVNSFGFGSSTAEGDAALSALAARITSVLPVELVSACAGYNHGAR